MSPLGAQTENGTFIYDYNYPRKTQSQTLPLINHYQ
jgi:hypothetical protein